MRGHLFKWSIDQNQWPLETFVRISAEFDKFLNDKDSLQTRIQNAFAAFIIYEMPIEHCLKDKKLIDIASMIRSNRWSEVFGEKNIRDKFIGFEGVLNCHKCGKIIRGDKVVWGYSLNDWMTDNS